jgi:hypothetical protein
MSKIYPGWEPKDADPEIKRCTTCQYEWFSTRFGPCKFCPQYENWKSVEAIESEVNRCE